MKNQEIADIFSRMADLLELLGENPFRVNSYRKAGRTLSELTEPVEDLAASGKLQDIPGIGAATAEKIGQYLQTGRIAQYEELLAQVPPKLPDLLAIPNLGPKTVAKLWHVAKIASVAELQEAMDKDPDRLTAVPGMGQKKLQVIRQSLQFVQSAGGRILLGLAQELAEELIRAAEGIAGVKRVLAAGSLRRGKETIGDIDLVCQAPASAGEKVVEAFTAGAKVQRVLAKGPTKGSVVLAGEVQADLRVVPAESFGAALAYFTGSKAHNIRLRGLAQQRGMKLNEYGLFRGDTQVAGADEEGIYKALGLQFVPPELREDRGEVEAAAEDKLPKLLELGNIRGDMHVHTRASDGVNTIEEMIQAARRRGYEYLAISDHSKSQVQANGLDEKRLAEHVRAIRQAAGKFPKMLVLAGVEVDIFKDGSLDFAADVLGELDFVVASPHSALSQKAPEATRRIIQAIESPHVHCIGHPSGRLIHQRPGMDLDMEKIAQAAARNGVALEINAHYFRLDLRDTHVRAAVEAGAKLLINSDAHSTGEMDVMRYGVTTARRGWARADDVINTYPPGRLKKWLASKA